MIVLFGGSVGSDGGYWTIVDGKVHHVPGWGVDSLREVSVAASIIQAATQFKTPGLADQVTHSLVNFVTKEIERNVNKGAQVVIIGGARAGGV